MQLVVLHLHLSFSLANLCCFQHNCIAVYNTTVETVAFSIIEIPSLHTTHFPLRPGGGSTGNVPRLTVFLGHWPTVRIQ